MCGRLLSRVRKRRERVTRWPRTVRPRVRDPLAQVAFVTRWERGEIGACCICHILIARFPEGSSNPSTRLAICRGCPFSRLKAYIAKEITLADARALGPLEDRQAYLLSVRMFSEVVRKFSVWGRQIGDFNQSAPSPSDFI
jgi:hypothetical protein